MTTPTLFTERLCLRDFSEDDAPAFFELRRNESLMKYIGRPRAQSLQDALDLIIRVQQNAVNHDSVNWAISLRHQPNQLIGSIGYVSRKREHHRAEIGYLLAEQYHRQGIMTEALQAVLRYGFEVWQLHSVEATIDPRNLASAGILEKNGFTREALHREDFYWNGHFYDSAIYGLLASEFCSYK